jgi:orotidine-5'-phosphate decarboxylase
MAMPDPVPFNERLARTLAERESLLCVGLDPEPERLPERVRALPPAEAVVTFNRQIVEATADLVAAYKPNLAFYEALGPAGLEALRQTLACIPAGVLTIADAKRGDIPNTMRFYARAVFDVYGFHAVTASPYLGRDALAPLSDHSERGVFVLCRTSNPGVAEVTDLLVDGQPLFVRIAERVQAWNENGNLGLVMGATHPEALAEVRARCPHLPILLPGVGAQQGDLEAAVAAGLDGRRAGLLVVAARQVLYATSAADYPAAARRAAQELRERINRVRWGA